MPSKPLTRKAFLKSSRSKMPFRDGTEAKKATTWRQKQSAYVHAGLRTLKAPMALGLHHQTKPCF